MTPEQKGFIQGQAWAIAVMLRHDMKPEELLAESSLTPQIMKEAGVDNHDAIPIRLALKLNKKKGRR